MTGLVVDRASKHKVELSSQQLHSELAEARGALEAYQTSEQKWGSEKTSYRQQIERLGEHITKQETTINAIEADNRRLVQV